MDRWQAMRIAVKVADSGSFAQAARQLHLSPAAITRAVSTLEDQLRARLFVRTTRSVKLTDAGSRYVEDCRRILADIDEAEAAAGGLHATPSGTLTLTAPILFGQMVVLPILHDYLAAYPAMRGRTLFLDRPVNLLEEDIDVAVRIGHLPDSGFTAIQVGSVRRVVCGAPAYFSRHGTPATPADLKDHRLIAPTGAWASSEWRFAGNQRITTDPWLQCNTNDVAIATALAGAGLTRVLHYQIGPALQAGQLQIVLAGFEEPALPIHVLYPEGRRASAKVKAFVDMAVTQLRAHPLLR